jgi:hypothetical protein
VPGAREPADVAGVADEIRGDDRSDAIHVGDRRARQRDCILDSVAELGEARS